jgi:hypothetical protein
MSVQGTLEAGDDAARQPQKKKTLPQTVIEAGK